MTINQIVTNTLKNISVPCTYLVWNDEKSRPNQYVTWCILNERGALYSDDKEIIQGYYIQVDIWSKYGVSHSKLKDEIELNMLKNGFVKRTYGTDKYEPETQIVHKPLNFYYYKEKDGR